MKLHAWWGLFSGWRLVIGELMCEPFNNVKWALSTRWGSLWQRCACLFMEWCRSFSGVMWAPSARSCTPFDREAPRRIRALAVMRLSNYMLSHVYGRLLTWAIMKWLQKTATHLGHQRLAYFNLRGNVKKCVSSTNITKPYYSGVTDVIHHHSHQSATPISSWNFYRLQWC